MLGHKIAPMVITRQNYVLIDFENTQLIDAEKLRGLSVKVVIFVGQNQKSLPIDLVKLLLEHPGTFEIFESAGSGKNALDFQLAFYAGRLFEREPEAYLHIVSRDKGFDPLILHIKSQGRHCYRMDDFTSLPFLHALDGKPSAEKEVYTTYTIRRRVEFALARIAKVSLTKRPRKTKTLKTWLQTQFQKQLPLSDMDAVVSALVAGKHLSIGAAESLVYRLK